MCAENISLTPGFSRVAGGRRDKNRLNGFSSCAATFTALKRGANEMISASQTNNSKLTIHN